MLISVVSPEFTWNSFEHQNRTTLGSALVNLGEKHKNQQTITCQVLAGLNKTWSCIIFIKLYYLFWLWLTKSYELNNAPSERISTHCTADCKTFENTRYVRICIYDTSNYAQYLTYLKRRESTGSEIERTKDWLE